MKCTKRKDIFKQLQWLSWLEKPWQNVEAQFQGFIVHLNLCIVSTVHFDKNTDTEILTILIDVWVCRKQGTSATLSFI